LTADLRLTYCVCAESGEDAFLSDHDGGIPRRKIERRISGAALKAAIGIKVIRMKPRKRMQLALALRNRMILFVSLFLFTGCTFLQLREETKILQYSTILDGNVSSSFSCNDMPIVVAAYTREKNKREIFHYAMLHQLGPYELIVPRGNYSIVAYADKNRNLCYDKDEAAGQYVGAESVIAPAGGVVLDLDIVIFGPETVSVDFPVGATVSFDGSRKFHSTSIGAIADLDDPLFTEAFGQKGYWSLLEFFKEAGGNIYFMDEYDPKKIPILFVHGACGSPIGRHADNHWRRRCSRCKVSDETTSESYRIYCQFIQRELSGGGVYREPDEKVKVQSISLRGTGINRTLVPMKEDADYFDCYLAGADFAIKSFFVLWAYGRGIRPDDNRGRIPAIYDNLFGAAGAILQREAH
jgi:hypothetical protein